MTRIWFYSSFLILSCFAMAQTQISGIVKASQGDVLPGVTVTETGTLNGTVTDATGAYRLQLESDGAESLTFSFVGMKTIEVPINGRNVIDVDMEEDVSALNEVVVVGYGTTQRKDVTGSIAGINSKELKDRPLNSLGSSLQGRAAGVQVTEASGEPGSAISIRIRGTNSINGNSDPLYIVDGIPISLGGSASGDDFSNGSNPLATLNPNDIESIEVLKDASATSIYGSRGTNGVVIITTKRAREGDVQVDVSSRFIVQNINNSLDLMGGQQFATVRNEQVRLLNPTSTDQDLIDNNLLPFADQDEYHPFPQDAGAGTDFLDAILRQAITKNYQISISGGSRNYRQILSVNYDDQEGIIIGSDMQRVNLHYNSIMNIGDRLTLNFDTKLNRLDNARVRNSTKTQIYGVVNQALILNPNIPLRDDDGMEVVRDANGNYVTNPLSEVKNTMDRTLNTDGLFSLTAQLEIVDGLILNGRLGQDLRKSDRDIFYRFNTLVGNISNGKYFGSTLDNSHFTSEWFFNYSKAFNAHNITADAGVAYENFETVVTDQEISNFTFDNLGVNSLQQGQTRNETNSDKYTQTLKSAFARVNYSFDDKYLLTLTARADGSSKFGDNNKWGFFPAVAGSYRISEESFFQVGFMNELKLRGSWGVTGSQAVAPYQTLATFGTRRVGMADAMLYNFTYPSRLANEDLKWASTETINVGLDIGLINNRVSLTLDYYTKETTDLLLNRQLPASVGFSSVTANLGSLENEGIEVTLSTTVLSGDNFIWNSKLNVSHNKTTISDLGENGFIDGPNIGNNYLNFPTSRTNEGDQIGLFYGWEVEGLIQTDDLVDYANGDFTIVTTDGNPAFVPYNGDVIPGHWKYVDQNDDGIINEDDRVVLGNPNPDLVFGWNNEVSIGRFDISVFLQGSYGNDIMNVNKSITGYGWDGYNSTEDWYANRWTLQNQHNDAQYPSGVSNLTTNNLAIEDGSYVRLKDLIVRYNLPVENIKFFRSASIYVSGNNLITLTKYSGMDPEVSSFDNALLASGIDYTSYPRSRSFIAGINLGF